MNDSEISCVNDIFKKTVEGWGKIFSFMACLITL